MKRPFKIMLLFVPVLLCFCPVGSAQQIAVKTNLAYWASTTPNVALEFGTGRRYSLEIAGGLNPFTFSDNKKIKHWSVQPEFRWWACEKFYGSFVGLHAMASEFNVGGIDIPVGKFSVLKDHRYEGNLYGAGLSYGYQWLLGNRWNFEAGIGAGYARVDYRKFDCEKCGLELSKGDYNYWGVTKIALSLIYIID